MPTFKTIRQVAAMGILPEFRLRQMQKCNQLPGIFSGTRFLVNVDALVKQLESMSAANAEGRR